MGIPGQVGDSAWLLLPVGALVRGQLHSMAGVSAGLSDPGTWCGMATPAGMWLPEAGWFADSSGHHMWDG